MAPSVTSAEAEQHSLTDAVMSIFLTEAASTINQPSTYTS